MDDASQDAENLDLLTARAGFATLRAQLAAVTAERDAGNKWVAEYGFSTDGKAVKCRECWLLAGEHNDGCRRGRILARMEGRG